MSLQSLTKDLTGFFNQKQYQKCLDIIPKVKLELLKQGLLGNIDENKINVKDLEVTRSILEIGSLSVINLSKDGEFKNYIDQLRPFYQLKDLSPSDNQNKLMALYLLLLLSQGDLATFHIELETFQSDGLTIDELEKDKFLYFPIKVEKWLIDGDYNKLFEILNQDPEKYPCQEFNLFKSSLVDAVRFEIYKNLVKAYQKLPLDNFKNLLFLRTNDDYDSFIALFQDELNLSIKNGFVHLNDVSQLDFTEEPTDDALLIRNVLSYAREMETII
uniref:26S proteasome non-ATPase regulatory particle subunit n=2 Tax=Komagataella phaffii TaxID=460519 RepID=C4R9G0_KOMPG|nr:26S proteasome non-ATPase regulatory particle subunit [Komagataella pastoris]